MLTKHDIQTIRDINRSFCIQILISLSSYAATILVRTYLNAFFIPSILKSFIIKIMCDALFFYGSVEKKYKKEKKKRVEDL